MSLTKESPPRVCTRAGLAHRGYSAHREIPPQDIALFLGSQAPEHNISRQRGIQRGDRWSVCGCGALSSSSTTLPVAPLNLPLSVSVRRTEMGTMRAGPNPTRQSVKRKRLAQWTRPWEPPGNVLPRDDRVLHAHTKGSHKRVAVQALGGGCCRQADIPPHCIRGGGIGVVRLEREGAVWTSRCE